MGKFYRLLLSGFALFCLSNPAIGQTETCAIEQWQNDAQQCLFQHYYMSKDWQRTCDSLLKICPSYGYLWEMKAMPSFKAGVYDCNSLDEAVKLDVERQLPYRAFMKCIFAKDYFGAIVDLKASEKLIHGGGIMDHSFAFYTGLCYLSIEKTDSAIFYFEKDIAQQKLRMGAGNEHYNSLFYIGLAYLQAKKNIKAEQFFKASIKAYSKFPEPNFYLGKLYYLQNKKKEASVYFENAKQFLIGGASMNEDNNIYVDYPFQIGISDIENELKKK